MMNWKKITIAFIQKVSTQLCLKKGESPRFTSIYKFVFNGNQFTLLGAYGSSGGNGSDRKSVIDFQNKLFACYHFDDLAGTQYLQIRQPLTGDFQNIPGIVNNGYFYVYNLELYLVGYTNTNNALNIYKYYSVGNTFNYV